MRSVAGKVEYGSGARRGIELVIVLRLEEERAVKLLVHRKRVDMQ